MGTSSTSGRQRSIVIVLALATLAGFFFLGRELLGDDSVERVGRDGGTPELGNLPGPSELALAGRIPQLVSREPRREKPAPEPAPEAAVEEPPAEEPPVVEPATPVAEEPPAPPAPAAPAPAPPPPPEPEPEPKPEPEPGTTFDDSG